MIFDGAYDDSCSLVGLAARKGDFQQLQQYLNDLNDYSIKDNRGWYPIHEAASNGHYKCVELLIKAALKDNNGKFDISDLWPNPYDDFLYGSPLYLAISGGHLEITKLLIPYYKIHPNECIRSLLAATNYPIILDHVLDHWLNFINHSHDGIPPLHHAISLANIISVETLLRKGADVNAVDKFGRGPLHIAAELSGSQPLKVVKMLVEYECNINAQDDAGCTPLYIASQSGNTEVLSLLLECGADPHICSLFYDSINNKNIRSCPICVVCEKGFSSCLKKLLPVTQPQMLGDNKICSPVISAVVGEYLECLSMLIKSGYAVDGSLPTSNIKLFSYLENESIFTVMLPWNSAKTKSYVDVIEFLILNGSSISIFTTQHSFCTLMRLTNPLSVDILRCLVKYGLIEALCNRWNMTFQHFCSSFAVDVLKMLCSSYEFHDQEDVIMTFGLKLDLLFACAFKISGCSMLREAMKNHECLKSSNGVTDTILKCFKVPTLLRLTQWKVRLVILKYNNYTLHKLQTLPFPFHIVQDLLLPS